MGPLKLAKSKLRQYLTQFLLATLFCQIFNPTEENIMPTETPTNEVKAEIEIKPLTAEIKIRKFSK